MRAFFRLKSLTVKFKYFNITSEDCYTCEAEDSESEDESDPDEEESEELEDELPLEVEEEAEEEADREPGRFGGILTIFFDVRH